MAFTYTWADAVSLVSKLIKGSPTATIDAQVCDMVSSEMYSYFPWRWTLTSGTLCTLTDGNQDFSPPANIYRLLRARMVRTDTTPDQINELTVRDTIAPDLVSRSYTQITSVSYEAGVGLIRLAAAVSVGTGVTLRIDGEWQTNPAKVTSTGQTIWFDDKYLSVAAEGLLYWYYKLQDDSRAGGKAMSNTGQITYAGQYGAFMAGLEDMARSEDYPATDLAFPDEPLGVGRAYTGTLNIYGII